MVGKVFAKNIVLDESVPPELVLWAENIDLAGRKLDVFARDAFQDAMTEGVSYIYTDMDAAPEGLVTQADVHALNRRPWLVHIKACQVLGWRAAIIGGVETLVQFRYRDDQVEYDGDFGEKTVPQIRVLTNDNGVSWATYRKPEAVVTGAEWILHEQGRIDLSEIPIAPVYANRTGFMAGLPPMADLAEVNQAHWQSQSDQRNILHVARVPMLVIRGAPPSEPITISVERAIILSDPAGGVEYVEHGGEAIGAGRDDLKDLEFQMQVLGLELMIPKPGGQSATGAMIDQAKMTAPLAMMAKALEDAIERSFGFMAEFAGLADGGSVDVNTDFNAGMNAGQDAMILIEAKKAGIMGAADVIRELQRRGIVIETLDADEAALSGMNDMVPPDPFANQNLNA